MTPISHGPIRRRRDAGGAEQPASVRLDRRWSARRRHRLPLVVFRSFVPVARAETRDVGLEGLFLELDDHALEAGTVVDLEIPLVAGDAHSRARVQALVTRTGAGGVGVMFLTFERRLFSVFERLLYG